MKLFTSKNHINFTFWILAISLMTGLTLPVLIKDGMFLDGMLYTSVSHNLANDKGTFWFPQFSYHNIGGLSSFHEHPPLVFGIQAVFFKMLGSSMYVERLYSFITMLVTAILITILWKEIFRQNFKLQKMGWLAIIMWIGIPVCFWSFANNMQENTMGIFILLSIIFMYKSFGSSFVFRAKDMILIFLAGISIFLASLSKGIPGFFPFAFPFLYWFFTKRISLGKTIASSIIIISVSAIIYTILFLLPESGESLSQYLIKRALHRISEDPTVESRFYILWRLFTELLPLLIVLLIVFSAIKFRFTKKINLKDSMLFIATGITGSIPLMLTMVQKGFYLVPALPYLAIGLAILIAPAVNSFIEKISIKSIGFRILKTGTILIFIFVIGYSFSQAGKISRDKDKLNDVYLIGKIVPRHSIIGIPESLWEDWGLQTYLIRYFDISVDPDRQHKYFLKAMHDINIVDSSYTKLNIPSMRYELFVKNKFVIQK